jgi:hypothetical protein
MKWQEAMTMGGVIGHSRQGYLSHGSLVFLHQLIHVLLVLLQPVLDLILLTLKAAQLLLQLDRGRGGSEGIRPGVSAVQTCLCATTSR